MLTYSGLIECTPPLTKEEVIFLNEWQDLLNTIYKLNTPAKKNNPYFAKIDEFLELPLTEAQRWTICSWAYSPMIKWNIDGMIVQGTHQKGQFRESVLAYIHLLLGEEPVIKNAVYQKLSFLHEHKFNGIVDSSKYTENGIKDWLYIVQDNIISSVEGCTIEEYIANPTLYKKQFKEDTCMDKLNRYFPPLYRYGQVVKSVMSQITPEKIESKVHKI
jgi:hypothetical protein